MRPGESWKAFHVTFRLRTIPLQGDDEKGDFLPMETDTSKNSGFVCPSRLCPLCEKLLDKACDAVRHHAAVMNTAVSLVRSGEVTEEQRQDYKTSLQASFNDAQSQWEAYREHLVEHGLVPKVT